MIAYSVYIYDSRLRREAEALVDGGHSVDFICLQMPQNNSSFYNGVRLLQTGGYKYQGSNFFRYVISYARFFTAAMVLVTLWHLKNRYDIIQIHTMPDFMVFAAIIPKLLGAVIVLDIHDLVPELFMSKFKLLRKHLFIQALIAVERASVVFAHCAIAVNDVHLQALVEHGNRRDRFSVLMNLPDSKIFTRREAKIRERTDNDSFRIIYHGTVSRRYCLDAVIRAIGTIREQIPKLHFSIIGVGDDQYRLIRLVEILGLSDLVYFSRTGVRPEEIAPIIQRSDVGIVPLAKDIFTQYTLPVKLLEYVSLGVPVLATRSRTIEAYFNDNMVRFVTTNSESAFAEAILQFYLSPRTGLSYAHNAAKFMDTHNWETQKLQYIDLLKSLLANR